MKKLIVALFITLLSTTALAATVHLSWTASTSNPDTYRVYVAEAPSHDPVQVWEGTELEATVNADQYAGTTYWYATAVLRGLESVPSNVVEVSIPVNPPVNLVVEVGL